MSSKPFGIYQIVIKKGGTVVALPVAQKLTFKERVKSAELEGDETLVATASRSNGWEWEIEAGGMPLEAYALLTGREVVETGVSPDTVKTLAMGVSTSRFPYVDIYGRSLGDGDDDIHCKLINAKITEGIDFTEEMGKFMTSKVKGLALDLEVIENETATALDVEAS